MPSTITQNTFTGYTLSDARAKVLRKLRVNDTTRYSPTKGTADYDWIDDALNIAQRTFATRTKCIKTYAIIQVEANYRTYRAPSGFIDIASAYFYNDSYDGGYKQIQIKSIAELNNEVSDWMTATDEDVEAIYIDRFHGMDAALGLYPVPNTNGSSVFFTSNSGDEYEWACPLYEYSHDYGIIIKTNGDDKFILPDTYKRIVGDIDIGSGNVYLEYFRLPMDLVESDQDMEMPYAYQDMIIEEAVRELLENNPEDSVEFKRAAAIEQKQEKQFARYDQKMKTPNSGRILKAWTAVEGWQKNMNWRKDMF
jgi:hypothetical protein